MLIYLFEEPSVAPAPDTQAAKLEMPSFDVIQQVVQDEVGLLRLPSPNILYSILASLYSINTQLILLYSIKMGHIIKKQNKQ